jgi:hypothetical protein
MVNHLVFCCRFAEERIALDIMGNVTVPNDEASGLLVR